MIKRRMKGEEHVVLIEVLRCYTVMVVKSEGKRPHRRHRRKWEDNIKMDHKEIEWKDVNWIHLTQDRDWWQAVVNTAMNLRLLKLARNLFTG
jgi:hypothetical protein